MKPTVRGEIHNLHTLEKLAVDLAGEMSISRIERKIKEYCEPLIAQVEAKARLNLLNEVRELVEKQKLGTYKEWIGATRKYGGTREEWEKLNNRGHDRVIDDLLSALKELEGENVPNK